MSKRKAFYEDESRILGLKYLGLMPPRSQTAELCACTKDCGTSLFLNPSVYLHLLDRE